MKKIINLSSRYFNSLTLRKIKKNYFNQLQKKWLFFNSNTVCRMKEEGLFILGVSSVGIFI